MSRLLRIAVVCIAAVATLSCVTGALVEPPEGFAVYSELPDDAILSAVSPEGVVYRVRSVENEPRQTLSFWSEALKVHLERGGYALLEPRTIEAPMGAVSAFEWVAPLGGADWIYLSALADSGGRIIIVEAAGPFDHFQRHRAAIFQSLESLSPEAGE